MSLPLPKPVAELHWPDQGELAARYVAEARRPFVLRRGVAEWPAVSLWSDPYLISVAGEAELLIKPRSDYKRGESQRECEPEAALRLREVLAMMSSGEPPDLSYARESNLLEHYPALKADVPAPALLARTQPHAPPRTGIVGPNAWIGPSQTRAQMHWDPEHNLYAQVRGRKRFVLVPPEDAAFTYPNTFTVSGLAERPFFRQRGEAVLKRLESAKRAALALPDDVRTAGFHAALREGLSGEDLHQLCEYLLDVNNCHVDAEAPDLGRHPDFAKATRFGAILESGDLMFIPQYWLHAVRSLDPSISINWFFMPAFTSSEISERMVTDILLEHLVP